MLESLKIKIQTLVAAYETAVGEIASLRAQAERDKEEIAALKAQIIELNKQIDSLKLKSAFVGSSTENSEAKKKVEKLINEIDKCISLMEQR